MVLLKNNPGERSGKGGGKGRNKGGSFGPGGYCICAKCGMKIPHEQGVKCTSVKCPECNKPLIREELLTQKKNNKNESSRTDS